MNVFIEHAHTIPLTDLITLNTIVIFLMVYVFCNYMKYNTNTTVFVLAIVFVVDIFIHPFVGIKNNVSYFFGQGEKPNGWRGY